MTKRTRATGTRYIYALLDLDQSIRYVGQTGNVRKRVRYHWTDRFNGRQPVLQEWLKSLSVPPAAVVLQEVPDSATADAAEDYWIKYLSDMPTVELLNEAGTPGYRNENAVAAMTAYARNRPPETRAALSESVRAAWREGRKTGRPISEETRQKISDAQRGRKFSEERKANLRAAQQRRWQAVREAREEAG